MSTSYDLIVTDLRKTFSTKRGLFGTPTVATAVDGISFAIKQGEILGLLGTNGAGKTTTVQMLLGLMTPTSGSITYFNKDFTRHRSEILNRVGFASTYVKLAERLTVYENLDIYGRMYGLSHEERIAKIEKMLKFFEMWNFKDRDAKLLSAGQITRVMLAKAFLADPQVVLLDEPTASLDPDVAMAVVQFVKEQRQERGISILFTSHNMDEVAEICDRVLVMDEGKIIADNTPQELARTVANSHMTLLITAGMTELEQLCQRKNMSWEKERQMIKIELHEELIPELLHEFVSHGIKYSYIAIDRPTLKDYFMSISTARRKRKSEQQ